MFNMKQGNMPSVQHQFSQVPSTEIQRSVFNRDHQYKTTFDSGYLVPIFVDEVLPGDTFSLQLTSFSRLSTPIVPSMDNLHMDFFFFFVPNRLVWTNWVKMMGEQENPSDSIDYTVPTITGTNVSTGTLWDYFGLPCEQTDGIPVNALPFRAYNLIYNTFFRDQNLQDSVVVDTDNGPDTFADYSLLRRGKRHDYFTSALPWPQKGDAITLPLGSIAPVLGIGFEGSINTGSISVNDYNGANNYTGYQGGNSAAPNRIIVDAQGITTKPNVYADLSNATAATINSIRQAFQLQRLIERDARGGTRYNELILTHFKTHTGDYRLQRPEYLGGGSQLVGQEPIPQTSGTDTAIATETVQGNLAAVGTSTGQVGFSKSFVEHGHIIGLVSVRADLSYSQGINRMWSRSTRYDFYWPVLAHLGEQTVLNKEIFYKDTDSTYNEGVWGYQERYAEYRYKPSQITGLFRPDVTGEIAEWHYSQLFSAGSAPVLNDSFIQDNPPVSRNQAVTSEPEFLYDSFIKLKCVRPMPLYSVPGLIDHF